MDYEDLDSVITNFGKKLINAIHEGCKPKLVKINSTEYVQQKYVVSVEVDGQLVYVNLPNKKTVISDYSLEETIKLLTE